MFLSLIIGAIGGFSIHAISMNVNFKQRTIDNKIKVYDSLISHWVKMRNYIYAHFPFDGQAQLPPEIIHQFDQMYGESQTFIGEVFLICEDIELAKSINELSERIYRTEWNRLALEAANKRMQEFKTDALKLIAQMRDDIKKSTRFDKGDFFYIVSGLWREKPRNGT